MGDDQVRTYARKEGIPVLMEIPFDRRIAETYSRGQMIVEVMPEWKEKFQQLYHRIEEIVGSKGSTA
jgi:MinD superfamily P-loop ATPase